MAMLCSEAPQWGGVATVGRTEAATLSVFHEDVHCDVNVMFCIELAVEREGLGELGARCRKLFAFHGSILGY